MTLKNTGYLQIKGAPMGQCQVSEAAPWSEPEPAHFSHAVDLDFLLFGQGPGLHATLTVGDLLL